MIAREDVLALAEHATELEVLALLVIAERIRRRTLRAGERSRETGARAADDEYCTHNQEGR
jgi:hypothetical protein